MAEQYRKIADYETTLYHPDSPVVIERMRLQHDLIYNVNVLQITFRNVDPLNIYGLGISIALKNEAGKKLYKDVEFNYYGIEVPTNHLFGTEEDVVVEPDVTGFEVTVTRADLAEGKRFRGKVLLAPAPAPQPLSVLDEFEQPFLDRIAQMKPKLKVQCAPENTDTYWRCVCKRIYPYAIKRCPSCRLKFEELVNVLPTLKQEKKEREAEEARLEKERQEEERRRQEEERLRLEEEERQRQEQERLRLEEEERLRKEAEELARRKKQKRKKQMKIGGAVLAGIALVTALFLILPKNEAEPEDGIHIGDAVSQEGEEYTAELTTGADAVPLFVNTAILGEDLDTMDTKTVWRLFGKVAKTPEIRNTLTVDNKTQQAYMIGMLGADNVEKKALSSVMILPKDAGYGLRIKMYNITYCTDEMYRTALTGIGLTDAEVVIAAPQKCSGSTALAGIYMMGGESLGYSGKGIGTATALVYINIRSGAGTNYSIYDTLKPGMEVEVLQILENSWLKIVWPACPEGYAFTCYNDGRYYSFLPNE